MTKNELKALIDKKVQRQGTQGAISLAPILNEIIDLIPEGGGEMEFITIDATLSELQNNTEIPISEEIQAKLGEEKTIIPVVIFVRDPKHYNAMRVFYPESAENYFMKFWRPLKNEYNKTNEFLKASTVEKTILRYFFNKTE